MRVHVVMGNDFPDAVFTSSETAEAYCEQKRAADRERDKRDGRPDYGSPRIHWRAYDFELKEAL
jgi:hypothetical protein